MEADFQSEILYEKANFLKRELNYLDKLILKKRKISFEELKRNKEILKLRRRAEEVIDDSYQFKIISDKIRRLEESSLNFEDFDAIYRIRDKIRDEIDSILIEIYEKKAE